MILVQCICVKEEAVVMNFNRLVCLTFLFSLFLPGCQLGDILGLQDEDEGVPTHVPELLSRSPDHLQTNVATNSSIVITGVDSVMNVNLGIELLHFGSDRDCWMEREGTKCNPEEKLPEELAPGENPVVLDPDGALTWVDVVKSINGNTATFTPTEGLVANKNYLVHLYNDPAELTVYWTFSTFPAYGFGGLTLGTYSLITTSENILTFVSDSTGTIFDGDGTDEFTWLVNDEDQLVVTTGDFTATFTITSGTASSGTVDIHWDDNVYGVSEETGIFTKQ